MTKPKEPGWDLQLKPELPQISAGNTSLGVSMSKSLLPFSPFSLLFSPSRRLPLGPTKCFYSLLPNKPFSSPSTPYPLQYDMIISRPSPRGPGPSPSPSPKIPHSNPPESESSSSSSSEPPSDPLSFDDWVDKKLLSRSQRKYYKKREKRMYGGADSDDEKRKLREKSEFVELNPEVLELRTLHKREEELYFYDTFCLPWEKDKHYKMVYQLEKKYFPQHSLDKAFLEPGANNKEGKKREEQGLMFFDKEEEEEEEKGKGKGKDLSEKKVEELFQGWKRGTGGGEPYVASRNTGVPNQWESPQGTVVLVNKPKGGNWDSYSITLNCFFSFWHLDTPSRPKYFSDWGLCPGRKKKIKFLMMV